MKRIEFLLRDIKNMSNIGGGSYSDDLLLLYFNEAQESIRNVIYTANNEANILKDRYYLDLIAGQQDYVLPSRIYAVNSILTAKICSESEFAINRFTPLRYINYKDIGNEYGYSLLNNRLIFSSNNSYADRARIELIYNSLLPKLAKRSGIVETVIGNKVNLAEGYDAELGLKTDYLTFVDSDGEVLASDVKLVEQSGGELTVSSSTGIVTGSYCLIGEYSTTHSRLPIECENFLRKYVERRVAIGDSSPTDSDSTGILSDTEKLEISSLFEKSMDDCLYPVISPETPWL